MVNLGNISKELIEVGYNLHSFDEETWVPSMFDLSTTSTQTTLVVTDTTDDGVSFVRGAYYFEDDELVDKVGVGIVDLTHGE